MIPGRRTALKQRHRNHFCTRRHARISLDCHSPRASASRMYSECFMTRAICNGVRPNTAKEVASVKTIGNIYFIPIETFINLLIIKDRKSTSVVLKGKKHMSVQHKPLQYVDPVLNSAPVQQSLALADVDNLWGDS